ncbi:MAG: SGNH/GDSL hydrolase family protein [Planctomycetota bacterium]|nr:MAG: SGNH/GDSL hydrolase family protein [Planctomycetota bacterium]REK31165.1 MAG: SGNH/GDSL hydrolase family protein [Planctomycetota bacterium]
MSGQIVGQASVDRATEWSCHTVRLHCRKTLCTVVAALLAISSLGAANDPAGWRKAGEFPAPEAHQAAAADESYIYAITNSLIAKYDRETGARVAVSMGPAKHLNSGFFHDGALYCAHSNYPQTPEQSEIKVLDVETMVLSTFHDFGDQGGSLTWAVKHQGDWWCNFAYYGGENSKTYLAHFDDNFKEIDRWTYPADLIAKLGSYSLSGGLFHANELLVTGHDDPVIFRVRVPDDGNVLELIGEETAPFTGQGIAVDPRTGGLVGIDRARHQVVFARKPGQLPFASVDCEGAYPKHLQGVCTNDCDAVYWSFTDVLVKTDAAGRVLKKVPVADHHGDLCFHDGRIYVAVNLGQFNQPAGKADSWVYIYDAETLRELARHEATEVVHGAGGIACDGEKFLVVGGLPEGIEENYLYEYDLELSFQERHILNSGYTRLGIQTAAYHDGTWWFGCYGTPKILLKADSELQFTARYEFDCSLGITGLPDGRILTASGQCRGDEGCTGSIHEARASEEAGLIIQPEIATGPLRLTLPPDVYAVAGVEFAIYFDNIVLAEDSSDYQFEVTCDIGTTEDDRWVVVPDAALVGNHNVTITVSDADGRVLGRAESVLHVAPPLRIEDEPLRLLLVGDSLTHATLWPNELARLLTEHAQTDWTMLGTHRPKSAAKGVAHEGYGGWTWQRFAAHYEPDPDGTYRKRSSPFVFLGGGGDPELDVARYIKEECDGTPPDVVVFLLGINDCFSADPDDQEATDQRIDTVFGHADTLLNAFHTAAPQADLAVCLTTPGNSRDEAFEANYKDRYPRWGWKRIQHRLVEREIAHFSGREGRNIFIVPTELNLDPTGGYPDNNAVHPNAAGYAQIAATIYAWLSNRLAEQANP